MLREELMAKVPKLTAGYECVHGDVWLSRGCVRLWSNVFCDRQMVQRAMSDYACPQYLLLGKCRCCSVHPAVSSAASCIVTRLDQSQLGGDDVCLLLAPAEQTASHRRTTLVACASHMIPTCIGRHLLGTQVPCLQHAQRSASKLHGLHRPRELSRGEP